MRHIMPILPIISLFSLLGVNGALATDIEINHGYQSNPYRLSADYPASRVIEARFQHDGSGE